jgi:peptidoglycan/xylan/chitin deacetylase (PgdA/CDA1 family)
VSSTALSFTFDDGPDETWTPLVLEQLARSRVKATFFMVGERLLGRLALARTVLDAGHEIQLHCHRHIRHTALTEEELQDDTEQALGALASIGVIPRLWRTPWGISTEASVKVAGRHGLTLVRWSIDTHDWRGDPPQRMLAHAHSHLPGGGAVLMHDALGPGARRTGCENTLELLPALATAARTHGLTLGPVPREPRTISQAAIGVPA